jgi:hypothetical protein
MARDSGDGGYGWRDDLDDVEGSVPAWGVPTKCQRRSKSGPSCTSKDDAVRPTGPGGALAEAQRILI